MLRKVAQILRGQGHPYTLSRELILKALKNSAIPLSPKGIYRAIPKPRPNLATIYRNLNLAQKIGLVRSVDLREGFKRYELVKKGIHEHRIVCRVCRRIQSFTPRNCNLKAFENMITKQFGFMIDDHVLEFYGLCPSCQKK